MSVKYRASYACDSESDLPSIVAQAGMGELAYCIAQGSVWRKYVGGWEAVPSAAQCYSLPVMAANAATVTDAQTIYFGGLAGLAPSATAALAPIYVPKTGTIKAAYINANAGTAGTNEAWPLSIRKNNSSDTLIASVSLATVNRLWSNTGLSIAVTQGDFLEIKAVNPTWPVTNPANVRFGGTIYIES